MSSLRIELALAVCRSSLSLDRLLAWGLASPVELWAFLDEARRDGWIAEDKTVGRGHFVHCDDARRAEVIEAASADDYRELTGHSELVGELLATARRLRSEGNHRTAGEIYRVLICSADPGAFAGGERDWLAAVVESIRMYREMYGVAPDMLQRAVAVAEGLGDVATQAVLLAAMGYRARIEGRSDQARELSRRATETARSAPSQARMEVHGYLAVGLIRQGRVREGVAVFEELFGDVPDDIVTSLGFWLDFGGPASGGPLGILADSYSNLGQHARAVDLMHRVLANAEARERPEVVAEAHLYLAFIHARQGSLAAATHAESAWRHYEEHPDEPMYVWFAGMALAWVRAMQGRIDDMRRVLHLALLARGRAGSPRINGTLLFDIDERLGPTAWEGLAGFDLLEEAKSSAAGDNLFGAGVAHRFLARRMNAEPASEARDERMAAHLEQSLERLRTAGTVPELSRALADAAAFAEPRGQHERARALREEQTRLRTRLPQGPASGPESRNAHLAALVLALGRLTTLRDRQDGFWGEIASRLSQGLGAERVALVEVVPEPRMIAVRGGDAGWRQEILALAGDLPAQVAFTQEGDATRVVVPFASEGYERAGVAVLENRYAPALVGERDSELLAALGAQLGVLFDNALMWKELAGARERLEHENRYFRESRPAELGPSGIVAHSVAMTAVLDLVSRVAPADTAVLVVGETGVGKELIAHEIHRRSARSSGPFIALHIASLAPGLVASSLFGHERGAFTGALEQAKGRFELADGGTLFLDEIGELSLEEQVRLVRVLQERTFERVGGSRPIRSDFRLVAATNRDLEAAVKQGRFREDLFFRLHVFPIRVPPLRERREEIPTLALLFMERFARNLGRSFEGISEADMLRLVAYTWPGNVRELEHFIERAVLLSDGPRLKMPALQAAPMADRPEPESEHDDWVTLEEAERRYMARVLVHTRGRITGAGGAAELLGLKPSTLNWRIDKLGLRDIVVRVRRSGQSRTGA